VKPGSLQRVAVRKPVAYAQSSVSLVPGSNLMTLLLTIINTFTLPKN